MSDGELSPARFGAAFKAFMEAVVHATEPDEGGIARRIREHLGTDPTELPVVSEEFDSFEQPNIQAALNDYLDGEGRTWHLLGVVGEQRHFMSGGISELVGRGWGGRSIDEGPPDYVNYHLAGDAILACVQFGLYLIAEGDARLVVLVRGPSDGRRGPIEKPKVEVMATRPEDGRAFLTALIEGMARLNVYRGHTISLEPGSFGIGPQTLVSFHTLPAVEREDVILPEGTLERIERQTIVFSQHAERLLAAGRSLKRGVLLYGPPGTGKTLTVTYLTSKMPGRTTLLTTGMGLGLLNPVAQMARILAPAMVVLEDVDLIAEERGNPFGRSSPLLFELLNELDGLGDDCDVIFVLTTNRPEILEPALAARPGRIDLAVELPLPDLAGRRRLLDLYARGLALEEVDLDEIAARTEGASPAYIKELLRKAATLAAAEGAEGDLTVTAHHLDAALAELDEGGILAQRILGFQHGDGRTSAEQRELRRTGYPARDVGRRTRDGIGFEP